MVTCPLVEPLKPLEPFNWLQSFKTFNLAENLYSNTPRLYSQWLNSVIYWLINHCTDWARTNVTSSSRQFDFHDVIYHKRRRNVVFTTT